MSTLQKSMRDFLGRHPVAGYLVMFCITFTVISFVLQILHATGLFPESFETTFGRRIGLAAFCALISLITRRSAQQRDTL